MLKDRNDEPKEIKCPDCGRSSWSEISWCKENKEVCDIGPCDECPSKVPVGDDGLITPCDNRTTAWLCHCGCIHKD